MKLLIKIEGGLVQSVEIENPENVPVSIAIMDTDLESDEPVSISAAHVAPVESILADNREHTDELKFYLGL